MPISGLVITLAPDTDAGMLVRHLQKCDPRLEPGEVQGDRLPCVLETAHAGESQAVHEWLLQQPGVLSVDVVFVGLEEPEGRDGNA
jgi:hypothetical protein